MMEKIDNMMEKLRTQRINSMWEKEQMEIFLIQFVIWVIFSTFLPRILWGYFARCYFRILNILVFIVGIGAVELRATESNSINSRSPQVERIPIVSSDTTGSSLSSSVPPVPAAPVPPLANPLPPSGHPHPATPRTGSHFSQQSLTSSGGCSGSSGSTGGVPTPTAGASAAAKTRGVVLQSIAIPGAGTGGGSLLQLNEEDLSRDDFSPSTSSLFLDRNGVLSPRLTPRRKDGKPDLLDGSGSIGGGSMLGSVSGSMKSGTGSGKSQDVGNNSVLGESGSQHAAQESSGSQRISSQQAGSGVPPAPVRRSSRGFSHIIRSTSEERILSEEALWLFPGGVPGSVPTSTPQKTIVKNKTEKKTTPRLQPLSGPGGNSKSTTGAISSASDSASTRSQVQPGSSLAHSPNAPPPINRGVVQANDIPREIFKPAFDALRVSPRSSGALGSSSGALGNGDGEGGAGAKRQSQTSGSTLSANTGTGSTAGSGTSTGSSTTGAIGTRISKNGPVLPLFLPPGSTLVPHTGDGKTCVVHVRRRGVNEIKDEREKEHEARDAAREARGEARKLLRDVDEKRVRNYEQKFVKEKRPPPPPGGGAAPLSARSGMMAIVSASPQQDPHTSSGSKNQDVNRRRPPEIQIPLPHPGDVEPESHPNPNMNWNMVNERLERLHKRREREAEEARRMQEEIAWERSMTSGLADVMESMVMRSARGAGEGSSANANDEVLNNVGTAGGSGLMAASNANLDSSRIPTQGSGWSLDTLAAGNANVESDSDDGDDYDYEGVVAVAGAPSRVSPGSASSPAGGIEKFFSAPPGNTVSDNIKSSSSSSSVLRPRTPRTPQTPRGRTDLRSSCSSQIETRRCSSALDHHYRMASSYTSSSSGVAGNPPGSAPSPRSALIQQKQQEHKNVQESTTPIPSPNMGEMSRRSSKSTVRKLSFMLEEDENIGTNTASGTVGTGEEDSFQHARQHSSRCSSSRMTSSRNDKRNHEERINPEGRTSRNVPLSARSARTTRPSHPGSRHSAPTTPVPQRTSKPENERPSSQPQKIRYNKHQLPPNCFRNPRHAPSAVDTDGRDSINSRVSCTSRGSTIATTTAGGSGERDSWRSGVTAVSTFSFCGGVSSEGGVLSGGGGVLSGAGGVSGGGTNSAISAATPGEVEYCEQHRRLHLENRRSSSASIASRRDPVHPIVRARLKEHREHRIAEQTAREERERLLLGGRGFQKVREVKVERETDREKVEREIKDRDYRRDSLS